MKCSGENVILRGIYHVVSCFPLHFMLYRRILDYFSDCRRFGKVLTLTYQNKTKIKNILTCWSVALQVGSNKKKLEVENLVGCSLAGCCGQFRRWQIFKFFFSATKVKKRPDRHNLSNGLLESRTIRIKGTYT